MATSDARLLDLEALLHPISLATFFETYWEQRPLHLRRDGAGNYDGVVTGDDLERVISSGDLRYPALQLARGGRYFPADAYTHDVKHGTEVFAGVPDLEQVITEYRSGTTLVLPALHRSFPALGALCTRLETFFDHAVHANAYLTPGRALGFSPHYDTHEVFVLQIAGRKHWRVYEPPVRLPHRTQPFNPTGYTPKEPILSLELLPGDLLYLPRGFVHSALTSESHSAHVTLGVTVYTWVELLTDVVGASRNVESLRRALPPGFASRAPDIPALEGGLVAGLRGLADAAHQGGAALAFLERVRAARGRTPPRFAADVNVITLDALLEVAVTDVRIATTPQGTTSLDYAGKSLKLPGAVRATLEAMQARRTFRLTDLPLHLDDNARLAFARFLEAEGFLRQRRLGA